MRVPLAGDWELWEDFVVRSAGFPVSGLGVFGPGDEPGRLRAIAGDARFREAVTWQNRPALANAVDKVRDGAVTKPSRMRQREEIVASYWQRYCSKNDTIGYFGPLAWGRASDSQVPLRARSGPVERERELHFEAWGIQALAETLDPELRVPTGPWPERDMRAALAGQAQELAALDRLEAARDAVAAAPPDGLAAALTRLDEEFVALTGRDPVRNPGRAYGARTLAYIDCMRDYDLELGRPLLDELAPALTLIFEAARWYAGRVNAIGRDVIAAALPEGATGPFGPVAGAVLGSLMALPPELAEVSSELQRRFSTLLADPDPATLVARAALTFADHEPAWRSAVYHSADVQIAAASAEAIAAGDYRAVIADIHPGANPLLQGVFAHRFPDPAAFDHAIVDEVGPDWPMVMPPFGPGMGVDARGMGRSTPNMIHLALQPEALAPSGYRTWRAGELLVDGDDLVDRRGELRVPLIDAFGLAIFVSGVRSFDPIPDADHLERLELGRVVLRRETWNVPAAIPAAAEDLGRWARDAGLPRRVFVKTPDERKPFLCDLESPVLTRIAARHIRRAQPEQRVRFSEMLPGPDECWLADDAGARYTSELRFVAVDRTRL